MRRATGMLEIDGAGGARPLHRAERSIAVDGVSLTTNAVDGARFTVNLIPHTLAVTTLGALHAGARVNLEVDLIARYVERLRRRNERRPCAREGRVHGSRLNDETIARAIVRNEE